MYTLVLPKFRIFAEKLERMNFWFSCVLGRIKSLLFDLHLLLPVRQRDCVAILRSGVVFLRRVMWWPGYDEPWLLSRCIALSDQDGKQRELFCRRAQFTQRLSLTSAVVNWQVPPADYHCHCHWIAVAPRRESACVCAWVCARRECVCLCVRVSWSVYRSTNSFSLFFSLTRLSHALCVVCVCVYVCLGVVCAVYPCDMCVCACVRVCFCVLYLCVRRWVLFRWRQRCVLWFSWSGRVLYGTFNLSIKTNFSPSHYRYYRYFSL